MLLFVTFLTFSCCCLLFQNGSKVCTESGRSPAITNYIVIVAHEVAHNEADQELAEAWNFNIFRRKYRLIQKGVESHVIWKTNPEEGYDKSATKTHFKVICELCELHFFNLTVKICSFSVF